MSRHLKALRRGGLVEESHPEFDARVRVIALRPDGLTDLIAWLERAEANWADQLSSLKSHIERSGP
jgi:DNA-binding transcriptional ArsR family regulator